MINAPTLPADLSVYRVIGAAEAADLLNISLVHWRRLYRTGKAPAPIRLTGRKVGWRVGDLMKWVDSASMREAA